MVTEFQERLRQIREEKDRESKQRREQDTVAEHERLARLELRFERRERIEKMIEGYGDKFIAEVPAFSRAKSFFEGKYKIEVHNDDLLLDAAGHLTKYFSRITFLLDTQPNQGAIHIQCKKTVRNRDLDSTLSVLEMPAGALEAVEAFVEEQYVEFADAYFSSKAPKGARSPSVG